MHEETRSAGFLVEPQNHWDGFLRFDLKTGGNSFSQLGLKIGGRGFFQFDIKIGGSGFLVWTSKSAAAVW
jgi:hypothetical protein